MQSSLSDLTTTADSVGPAMGGVAEETGAATDSMDGLNESTMWSMQGMMGLSSTIRMGITDYERMDLMHVRLEQSTLAVQKAQEAYTAAVKAHGAASQQAIQAQEALQVATDRLNYYQERNTLNYVQMGLQIPMVIASITQLTGGLGGLGGALGSAGEAIGGVVAALGPIGIAIIAVVAAIAILYEAWVNDWGGIREKAEGAIEAIKNALIGLGDWLKANWQDILTVGLTGPVGIVYEAWVKNWGGFRDIVTNALTGISDWLKANWQSILTVGLTGPLGLVYEAWKNNWGGFRDVVTITLDVIGKTLSGMKDAIAKPIQDAWTAILDTTTKAWDQIKQKVNDQMPLIGGVTQTGMDVIHGNWQAAWQDLSDIPAKLLDQMQKTIAGVMDNVKNNIKIFTDAFKAAEDFLKPILADITTAVKDFLEAVEKAFQDFYDWLVGSSLWIELWNQIIDIAAKMTARLLSDLQSKFFDIMRDAFTKATELIEDIWTRAWQAIQNTFATISAAIQAALTMWFNQVESNFTTAMNLLSNTWTAAWQLMQTTFQTISSAIQAAWQNFLTTIQNAMNALWSAIEAATNEAFALLENSFTSAMTTIEGILDNAISMMEGAWGAFTSWLSSGISAAESAVSSAASTVSSTLGTMQSAASSAASGISGAITGAFDTVSSAATNLWKMLTGGSVWTNMLNEMQSQTHLTMANITDAFKAMSVNVPGTIGYGAAVGPTPGTPTAVYPGSLSLSIPVTSTLQVDGQIFSRVVEKRIVNRIVSTMKKAA